MCFHRMLWPNNDGIFGNFVNAGKLLSIFICILLIIMEKLIITKFQFDGLNYTEKEQTDKVLSIRWYSSSIEQVLPVVLR